MTKILRDELRENGIIELRPMNRGYRLVGSEEELASKLLNNNVACTGRSLSNNNDIFNIALKVSEWIKHTDFAKKNGAKKLF